MSSSSVSLPPPPKGYHWVVTQNSAASNVSTSLPQQASQVHPNYTIDLQASGQAATTAMVPAQIAPSRSHNVVQLPNAHAVYVPTYETRYAGHVAVHPSEYAQSKRYPYLYNRHSPRSAFQMAPPLYPERSYDYFSYRRPYYY